MRRWSVPLPRQPLGLHRDGHAGREWSMPGIAGSRIAAGACRWKPSARLLCVIAFVLAAGAGAWDIHRAWQRNRPGSRRQRRRPQGGVSRPRPTSRKASAWPKRRAPAATARTASARPRACPISPASGRPTSTSSCGPINRAPAATTRWTTRSSSSTTTRWSRSPPTTPASIRRNRQRDGGEGRARQARPGPGRQGRRGSLRRLPRRNRHQQDARDAEPRRAGSEIPGRAR